MLKNSAFVNFSQFDPNIRVKLENGQKADFFQDKFKNGQNLKKIQQFLITYTDRKYIFFFGPHIKSCEIKG